MSKTSRGPGEHRNDRRHAATPRRVRLKSAGVAIGFTAVVAVVLLDHESSPDYAAVCVDEQTQQRIDDDQCEHGGTTGAGWYYIGSSGRVPAVGATAYGGTYDSSSLSGEVQRGGLPTKGGASVKSTTVRGGFGGAFHGISS